MRVGLFTESYDPVINGVSTSVKTLAAELTALGHFPVVVAPRFRGFADETTGGAAPVRVIRLFSLRTPLNPQNPFVPPPFFGRVAPALIKDSRFDVIHTQQPFGLGMHGRALAAQAGAPLVSTYHTLYNEYAHYFPLLPRGTVQALVSRHLRLYYNGCDAVIVPSRAAGRVLENSGVDPGRIRVVPTGVPAPPVVLPAAVVEVRRALDLPAGAPVLLFVGRLAREKNLDLLLGAFARLVAAGRPVPANKVTSPPPVLLLVGSGPYQEACEQQVRKRGLSAHVRFAGFLTRTQLAPVYALASVFAFPSATETQGVVLSEAQSHGLPCVVVNGGGAPEFVRSGVDALVVPPGDEAAFAEALQALIGDDVRRRAMGAAALASPLRPTPEAMARQVLTVYAAAAAGETDAAAPSARLLPARPDGGAAATARRRSEEP